MMKKDISANLNQNCLIFCSKILLNVLHNLSLTVLLAWVPDLSNIKSISRPSLAFHFDICKWCLIYMIQQAYKYVSSCLWTRLAFFELKITNILKSSGWGLEKSELPWEQNFFIAIGVFLVELSACQVSKLYIANWPR